MRIVAETTVATTIGDVWQAWTTPDDIAQWNAASDDWHTTKTAVDLRVGGTYTRIERLRSIESAFGDHVLLVEQQRQGWQAILDNFGKHVEARKRAMTG